MVHLRPSSSRRALPSLVALVAIGVSAGAAAVAEAGRPRVSVIGDDWILVAAVERALAGRVELVDAPVEVDDAHGIVTGAYAHRLDAVVTVEQREGAATAALVAVRDGASGRIRGTLQVRGRAGGLGPLITRRLWPRLGQPILGAQRPSRAPDPSMRRESVATARAARPAAPEMTPAPPVSCERAPSCEASYEGEVVIEVISIDDPADRVAAADLVDATEAIDASDAPDAIDPAPPRSRARGRRVPRLAIALAERPFWRRLRYFDDLDDALRDHDLLASAVGVSVRARVGAGFALALAGERTVGVTGTATEDGSMYATAGSEWSAALAWGVRGAAGAVGLEAGYGEQRFAIDDDARPAALVPDVHYRWWRAGVTAELALSRRWTADVGAGWRHLVDTGELHETGWFPRATGVGIDGTAGLTFHHGRFAGFVRGELRRYGFALHVGPDDAVRAGGLSDEYIGGAVGVAVGFR